ncbi:hypothetical protein [Rothia sp. CCM 9419]|uniref:hypothetical protein n=1 Tax=Rothia sp. CCM 9419 TaxID=3402662 RepID=UPI003AEA89CF
MENHEGDNIPVLWQMSDIADYAGFTRKNVSVHMKARPLKADFVLPNGKALYLPENAKKWIDSQPKRGSYRR